MPQIGGHNLCCDVFGAHSEGEVKRAGLSFHGEAGLREWEVTAVDDASVTMKCRLYQSQLEVSRTFTPAPDGSAVIKVTERLKNLVGTDRAMGRSQHVTLGAEILKGGVRAIARATSCPSLGARSPKPFLLAGWAVPLLLQLRQGPDMAGRQRPGLLLGRRRRVRRTRHPEEGRRQRRLGQL